MPELDVSDVLLDPDLGNRFQVIRNAIVVDGTGRTEEDTPRTIVAFGSVQPASGRTLNIMPDLTNVNGSIEIYTRTKLQVASATFAADVIAWQNKHYRVMTVVDYTNFGRGWVRAVASLIDFQGPGR